MTGLSALSAGIAVGLAAIGPGLGQGKQQATRSKELPVNPKQRLRYAAFYYLVSLSWNRSAFMDS